MLEDDDSPFLTIDETAELLRIKRRTLDNLRWSGDGPPARRHGGRIVYHRREVLDWSERRRTRTPPRPASRRLGRRAMLGLGLLAIVTPRTSQPCLLWNASASVPIGLYELVPRAPARRRVGGYSLARSGPRARSRARLPGRASAAHQAGRGWAGRRRVPARGDRNGQRSCGGLGARCRCARTLACRTGTAASPWLRARCSCCRRRPTALTVGTSVRSTSPTCLAWGERSGPGRRGVARVGGNATATGFRRCGVHCLMVPGRLFAAREVAPRRPPSRPPR